MRFKITPEMEASMKDTKAEMEAAMCDPSFRAEVEELKLKYKAREFMESILCKPANERKFGALSKRCCASFNISFGGGEPTKVENVEMAFA